MRPSGGSLHVDGHALPARARRVRRISALGLMEGVNTLDDRLRVRELLSEGLLLRTRTADRGLSHEVMEAAGLADLDRRALVRDLDMLERRRLGVALALLAEPRLLAVDDVDGGLGAAHQFEMWSTLRDLAEEGLTVIATCADAGALPAVAGSDVLGPIPIRQGTGDGPDPAPGSGDRDQA